jgi:hypothetical protein
LLIPQNAEEAKKVFHIFGWRTDGTPLIRFGLNWIGYSGQTRAFLKTVRCMEVNECRTLPFRTIGGEQNYQIKRVL